MIARKGLHGAAGAIALVAAALATASTADARCASRFYVGEADGIFSITTGIAARSDWRAQVRENIGSNFALWSRAINKSTRCRRPEGGGRWFCRARAIPCND
ncbi:MAG TPA: hypothetical protein VGF29_20580 [Hyphomicrobiaceae bacterium]|jgi:hypothetical protein